MYLLVFLLLLALPAHAEQQPARQLEQVQRQLRDARADQTRLTQQAESLDRELNELRRKLIAANTAADDTTARLQELEDNLNDLEGTAARRAAQLANQRRSLSETLALLQRLALTPPAAQLISPTPPLDRLRTDLQLKAILPDIQARAAEIASTVSDLNALRQRLEQQRRQVVSQRSRALQQSRDLDQLVAERDQRLAATRHQSQQARQRAEQLAGQAHDLRELIDRLEAEPVSTPAPALPLPPGTARQLPVSAPVLIRFGQRDSYGNVSKGLTLRPRAGARIASVAAGRVAFAGPFRGYGRVLILSHPGGFHTVLAGLAQASVNVGDIVAAGEPVGEMGDGTERPPELYFEVRAAGTPVDPLGARAQGLTRQH